MKLQIQNQVARATSTTSNGNCECYQTRATLPPMIQVGEVWARIQRMLPLIGVVGVREPSGLALPPYFRPRLEDDPPLPEPPLSSSPALLPLSLSPPLLLPCFFLRLLRSSLPSLSRSELDERLLLPSLVIITKPSSLLRRRAVSARLGNSSSSFLSHLTDIFFRPVRVSRHTCPTTIS